MVKTWSLVNHLIFAVCMYCMWYSKFQCCSLGLKLSVLTLLPVSPTYANTHSNTDSHTLFVYVHMHTVIHTYTHIHMYTHTYTQVFIHDAYSNIVYSIQFLAEDSGGYRHCNVHHSFLHSANSALSWQKGYNRCKCIVKKWPFNYLQKICSNYEMNDLQPNVELWYMCYKLPFCGIDLATSMGSLQLNNGN